MKISEIYSRYESFVSKLKDIPLLFMRLILAYGFYEPAKMKWSHINSVIEWFGSLGIPAPAFNAYLSASTEVIGIVLLVLGLGTRVISIPLIVVLLVAIKTVHWVHGFEAGQNGYEIPLYYIIMLIALITFGSGRFSVDRLIKAMRNKKKS